MEDIRCSARCGACDGVLTVKRSVEASVLDVAGWRKVRHTLLRCRRLGCGRRECTVGYNFYNVSNTDGGQEQYMFDWRDENQMKFFFMNVSCGATTGWLRQFSRRVTFQHTSFDSEAKIHLLDAVSRGVPDIVPKHARKQLLRLWICGVLLLGQNLQ